MNWLQLAQRLQLIAQTGRTYSEGEYDQQRYTELLEMVDEIYRDQMEDYNPKIKNWLFDEKGYLTPKVDVRGVVVRDDTILLVHEKIDGCWSLPGGWADTGLTPNENVKKEVLEEAGLETEPQRLLAVMDKKMHNHPPEIYYIYKLFIHCTETGKGNFIKNPETYNARFFPINKLPPLSLPRNTEAQIHKVLEILNNNLDTYCD